MPANVGMFEFRLDFDGNNGDILDFIKYINKSGDPAILMDEGTAGLSGNCVIVLSSFGLHWLIKTSRSM